MPALLSLKEPGRHASNKVKGVVGVYCNRSIVTQVECKVERVYLSRQDNTVNLASHQFYNINSFFAVKL